MKKNFLIVNASYYSEISQGLLKSAINLLPKKSKIKTFIRKVMISLLEIMVLVLKLLKI